MELYDSFDHIDEQEYIMVVNKVITKVSKSFINMTQYPVNELLHKNISEIFGILRVGPSFDIENIDEGTDYFLFTKPLEVRFVKIKILNEPDRQIYIFKETPNSRIEDKFNYGYQLISENTIGVSIYSVPDFTLLRANQVYLDFCDKPFNTPENTFGRTIYDFVDGYKGSNAEKIINNVLVKGKSEFINEMRCDNLARGVTYWDQIITPIKEDGKVRYIITNTQEVTEHVLNKIKLEENNKQLKSIIKSISDSITIVNKDGMVTEVSDNINEKFDNYGKMYEDVYKEIKVYDFDGNIIPLENTVVGRILKGEKVMNQKSLSVVNGRKFYFKDSGVPIFNDKGEFELGIVISDDITELIEQKNMIKEQKELLETELRNTKLLQNISMEFLCEDNIQALYEGIIDTAMQTMHSQYASMQIVYPGKCGNDKLKLLAYRGLGLEAAKLWESVDSKSSCTACSEALRRSKRIVAPNVKECDFMIGSQDQAMYMQTGIDAVQSTPLRSRSGRVVGMICTHWSEPYEPSERELRLMDVLARQAADLIDQRQAEEALRYQANILRIIDDAVIVFDKYQHVTYWNHGAQKMYGWTAEEAMGKTPADIFCPMKHKNKMSLDKEKKQFALRSDELIKGENIQRRKDGSEFWVEYHSQSFFDNQGNLEGFVIMQRDISERKRVEKAMRESESIHTFQSEILESVRDPLWATDANLRIMYWNDAAAATFGWTVDEVKGRNTGELFKTLVPGSTRDAAVRHLMNTGDYHGEFICHCKDGKSIFAEVSSRTVCGPDGEVVRIVNTARDITERKRIEAEREQLQREKNESLKRAMEMKDEFLSLISHEFRTPLNVISSAIQTLNFVYADQITDKVKEYMGIIKQNTNRQLRLVNNLLDITRANAGRIKINKRNMDIVFLTKAITESVHDFAAHKKVEVSFVSALSKKTIGIDDEKYERIILNLLSNAIKFTPEGKSIMINLRSIKGGIRIEVKDKGIGIPPDKLNTIFERFGQVDSSLSRQAEGTGIGLSLVKKFVEALGGSVEVKSRVGKGTTFTLLLPDEKIAEDKDERSEADLMGDSRLIQTTNIEFSDIYL